MKTLDCPGDQAEIVARLRQVRPDSPRRWGRMSAPQMVCHLADAFRMALGDRPVAGTARLRDRTVIKWIALYVPAPWPPGIISAHDIASMVSVFSFGAPKRLWPPAKPAVRVNDGFVMSKLMPPQMRPPRSRRDFCVEVSAVTTSPATARRSWRYCCDPEPVRKRLALRRPHATAQG